MMRTGMMGLSLFAAAVLLAACSPARTVILTNDTDGAVRASISRELMGSGDRLLAAATVGPGETGTLGPVSAPLTERVTLRVDPAIGLGAGIAESERLGWGTTRLRVVIDELSPTGLSLVPTDE